MKRNFSYKKKKESFLWFLFFHDVIFRKIITAWKNAISFTILGFIISNGNFNGNFSGLIIDLNTKEMKPQMI